MPNLHGRRTCHDGAISEESIASAGFDAMHSSPALRAKLPEPVTDAAPLRIALGI